MNSTWILDQLAEDVTHFGGAFLYGVVALVALLLGQTALFWRLFAGFALSFVIVLGIRLVYFTDRPKKQVAGDWIQRLDAASFPSMHAARSTVLAFLMGTFFGRDALWAVFGLLALAVWWSRWQLRKHFVRDLAGGFVVGTLTLLVIQTVFS